MEIKHWLAVAGTHFLHALWSRWLVRTERVAADNTFALISGAVRWILVAIRNNIKKELPMTAPQMQKAYDLKNLLQRLEGQGIEIAEESAKVFIKELVGWLGDSADLSENKIDDLAKLGHPELMKLALGLAENINKADNNVPGN